MRSQRGLIVVPDSESSPLLGSKISSQPIDPRERIQMTIVVRSRRADARKNALLERLSRQLPRARRYLDSQQILKFHHADPKELAYVERFARAGGLKVLHAVAFGCCVVVEGTLSTVAKTLHIEFYNLEDTDGLVYRAHRGCMMIPARLHRVVDGILGVDSHPAARRPRPHHHKSEQQRPTQVTEVEKAYAFPADADGRGQCIAIIELDGGFHQADIDAFASAHGLPRRKITAISLRGQPNNPAKSRDLGVAIQSLQSASPNSRGAKPSREALSPQIASQCMWTIETTLDVDLAMAFAPGAEIVVYFTPNSSQGKYWALMTALTDRKYGPCVISCSWGTFEENISPVDRAILERVYQSAALRGITLCSASGDLGDGSIQDGKPHVQAPASDPFVLACGGTHLSPHKDRVRQRAWRERVAGILFAGGGGVSRLHQMPAWQRSAGVRRKAGRTGRGVPDIAGKADIRTGYQICLSGHQVAMGGTSAVAPMVAGLIARLNQKLGARAGYLNPLLYGKRFKRALQGIIRGRTCKRFRASPGWDPCTGLGSPNGVALLAALSGDGAKFRIPA